MLFRKLAPLTTSLVAFIALTSVALAGPARKVDARELEATFDLSEYKGMTFLELMQTTVKPALDEIANSLRNRLDHDSALEQGKGANVILFDDNYNYHVNYSPLSERGGRSFGWSHGVESDQSDKDFLNDMGKLGSESDAQLNAFYKTLIEIIGDCDAAGYSKLNPFPQLVATNFMAIYGAEEYRHLVGNLGKFNWDDALLQVTMLASFHAGQSEFTKFYRGIWATRSFKQQPGSNGTEWKNAEMNDYWQFSSNPDPKKNTRSGINLTRRDFEKLGREITAYGNTEPAYASLQQIQSIIGVEATDKENIFGEIAKFYISKEAPSKMTSQTKKLAKAVAAFLADIRHDADDISKFIAERNPKRQ